MQPVYVGHNFFILSLRYNIILPIYISFLIITWKIEMAPKELHILQFLFFPRFIFIKSLSHNTRVSNLLWCEFKGYCVRVRDIYAKAIARREKAGSQYYVATA